MPYPTLHRFLALSAWAFSIWAFVASPLPGCASEAATIDQAATDGTDGEPLRFANGRKAKIDADGARIFRLTASGGLESPTADENGHNWYAPQYADIDIWAIDTERGWVQISPHGQVVREADVLYPLDTPIGAMTHSRSGPKPVMDETRAAPYHGSTNRVWVAGYRLKSASACGNGCTEALEFERHGPGGAGIPLRGKSEVAGLGTAWYMAGNGLRVVRGSDFQLSGVNQESTVQPTDDNLVIRMAKPRTDRADCASKFTTWSNQAASLEGESLAEDLQQCLCVGDAVGATGDDVCLVGAEQGRTLASLYDESVTTQSLAPPILIALRNGGLVMASDGPEPTGVTEIIATLMLIGGVATGIYCHEEGDCLRVLDGGIGLEASVALSYADGYAHPEDLASDVAIEMTQSARAVGKCAHIVGTYPMVSFGTGMFWNENGSSLTHHLTLLCYENGTTYMNPRVFVGNSAQGAMIHAINISQDSNAYPIRLWMGPNGEFFDDTWSSLPGAEALVYPAGSLFGFIESAAFSGLWIHPSPLTGRLANARINARAVNDFSMAGDVDDNIDWFDLAPERRSDFTMGGLIYGTVNPTLGVN